MDEPIKRSAVAADKKDNKWSDMLDNPLFVPKGTIRDVISLVFAIGFVIMSNNLLMLFAKATDMTQFNMVFTTFVGVVNLVLGYYFGNRNGSK